MEIKLLESDMNKMRNMNQKNKWAISYDELLKLAERHRTGNDYDRALIEYRLTDINFHSEVGLLVQSKYEELKKAIVKEMQE